MKIETKGKNVKNITTLLFSLMMIVITIENAMADCPQVISSRDKKALESGTFEYEGKYYVSEVSVENNHFWMWLSAGLFPRAKFQGQKNDGTCVYESHSGTRFEIKPR